MSNAILRLTVTHSPLSPAVRTRLELATPGVTGRYSNRLNYRTKRSVSKNLVIGFPATDPHSRLTEFLVVCECKVTTLFRTAQVFPQKFSKNLQNAVSPPIRGLHTPIRGLHTPIRGLSSTPIRGRRYPATTERRSRGVIVAPGRATEGIYGLVFRPGDSNGFGEVV